jgi:hypothetical protein
MGKEYIQHMKFFTGVQEYEDIKDVWTFGL